MKISTHYPLMGMLLSLVVTLSACSFYANVDSLGPTIAEINKMPITEASALIADQTIMTFQGPQTTCPSGYFMGTTYIPNCYTQPGHGTQIEYFSPKGIAFLWYPGNSRSVPSIWKLETGSSSHRICFQYPSSSRNAITGTNGGAWECVALGYWAKDIVEKRTGDIFSLSTGRLPSQLSRQSTTFDALLKVH